MDKLQQLLQKAISAKANAYAPYSHYQVGAAVLSDKGNIYAACNVENISFPCGTCAEAGAISAMVTAGDTKIKSILITSNGKELVYPCGACLQRIAEFGDNDTIIYLANTQRICQEYTLKNLLPYNFNEESIGK
jgi:cytidine deaminase